MPGPATRPRDPARFPAIPYGLAYFKGIRREGCLYVDKTRFLRRLEQERFVFFVRPRRFGKTCWLSMLESYYDRNQADDFDDLFGGLDIGRRPTLDRGRYVVLRFNFSTFGSDPANLEREFDEYCRRHVRDAMQDHPDLFPDAVVERVRAPSTLNGQLDELFVHARREGIPLYVLIDEYDNFANTILAGEGPEAYHAFTRGGDFYRSFFAALKAGTENGSVRRLFVTGVSPITMDDVTSGFNIGVNLSLRPEFNEMLGFTGDEVRSLLERYRDLGVFDQDLDAALDHARVVRRLPVREGRQRGRLQHRHGALLPAALTPQQAGTGQPDRLQRAHRLRQAAPPAADRAAVERQLRPAARRDRRRAGGQRGSWRRSRSPRWRDVRTSFR